MSSLSKKMQDALNKQINAEFFSAYLYLSMSSYLDNQNYKGMATWMYIQAQEEIAHGMKLFNYINDRKGSVKLLAIPAPQTAWKSVKAIFEHSYKHECKVTAMINHLVELALKEKDHATHEFLQWYVKEQIEEESTVLEIVEKIKMSKEHTSSLFIIDSMLSKRKEG